LKFYNVPRFLPKINKSMKDKFKNFIDKVVLILKKQRLIAILSVASIIFISSCLIIKDYEKRNNTTQVSENGLEENKAGQEETDIETSTTSTQSDISSETESSSSSSSSSVTSSTSVSKKTTTSTTATNTTTTQSEEPEPEPEPEPENPSAVVAFYSDNQSDTDEEDVIHQRAVNYILNSGANPIFHAGDLMEDGTQDSLDRFNSVTVTLRSSRTFYAALGNNDREVGDPNTPSHLFLNNFVFPNNEQWYSVNYGNLHMVILDSAFSSTNPSQLSWLSSDLQSANSQTKITGVMYHHPSFSGTVSTYLINYDVDFIISGHLHAYSHSVSNDIHYFVLSGQPSLGYIVARIYSDNVSITVYNNYNGVVDSVEFNER